MLDLSVIIPFKDKSAMTLDCLHTLQKYGGDIKEIILISNNSSDAELKAVERGAAAYKNTEVLFYNHPFNYHTINNWGVKKSIGKVVFLLNNDIELTEHSVGLLEKMYDKSLLQDVGAVGCVLLYEDRRTIQHAGVYLVPGGTADHLYGHKTLSSVDRGIASGHLPFDIHHDMQLNAVTAAAVMVERKKYDEIKGLNDDFIICGGDVDLCLRLAEHSYKTFLIGTESGYMLHKESKSRSMISVPFSDFVESYKIYSRHFDITKGDPYLPWKELQRA